MVKIGSLPIGSIVRFHFSGTWFEIVDETKCSDEYLLLPVERPNPKDRETQYIRVKKDRECELKITEPFSVASSLHSQDNNIFINTILTANEPLSFFPVMTKDKEFSLCVGDSVNLFNIYLGSIKK